MCGENLQQKGEKRLPKTAISAPSAESPGQETPQESFLCKASIIKLVKVQNQHGLTSEFQCPNPERTRMVWRIECSAPCQAAADLVVLVLREQATKRPIPPTVKNQHGAKGRAGVSAFTPAGACREPRGNPQRASGTELGKPVFHNKQLKCR